MTVPDGAGKRFWKEIPGPFFDVGIAEAHAVTRRQAWPQRFEAGGGGLFVVLTEGLRSDSARRLHPGSAGYVRRGQGGARREAMVETHQGIF